LRRAGFKTAGNLLVVEDLKRGTNPADKGGRPKDIFEMAFSVGTPKGGCRERYFQEVVSKPHLASDSCVADLFKMLTYFTVCCAFSSACALLSNAIWHFETTS
jgi:hypothetical protein